MERTESRSLQVHPTDEQFYIDIMQYFNWNLQSSQEINTKDSHLETRGDKLYSVTESTRYVKLVFVRPFEFTNKHKFVELETEYFSLKYPKKLNENSSGCLYMGLLIVGSFFALTYLISSCFGIGALKVLIESPREFESVKSLFLGWIAAFIFSGASFTFAILAKKEATKNKSKVKVQNTEIEKIWKYNNERRDQILNECYNMKLIK